MYNSFYLICLGLVLEPQFPENVVDTMNKVLVNQRNLLQVKLKESDCVVTVVCVVMSFVCYMVDILYVTEYNHSNLGCFYLDLQFFT